jgi:uncharacterized protein YlbG (UPF0298 family)
VIFKAIRFMEDKIGEKNP